MKMNPVHIAWQRMLRKRTCPQLDLLKQGGEAVEQHVLSCEHCHEKLSHAKALEALASVPPKAQPHTDALKTGDVCQLLRSAAPDGIHNQHGWHNPPMVLVLDATTSGSGFVRVAQIHDADELADEGDFLLTDMFADCFAESWNTWPALVEDLIWLGKTSQRIAQAVQEASQRNHPAPAQSVLFFFRQQELNIGGFFGRRAAERIMQRLETADDAEDAPRPRARITHFREWTSQDKFRLAREVVSSVPSAMAAGTGTPASQDPAYGRQIPGAAVLVHRDGTVPPCRLEVMYSVSIEGDTVFVLAEGRLPEECAGLHVDKDSSNAFVPDPSVDSPTAPPVELFILSCQQGDGGEFRVDMEVPAERWHGPCPLLLLVAAAKENNRA